jgi:hypothetical protein
MPERCVSAFAKLACACALTLSATTADPAPDLTRSRRVEVDVSGPAKDVVRLTDLPTSSLIAVDRIEDGPIRESLVSSDGTIVAVRHGADDDGDSLAVYAIAWRPDPVSGVDAGKAAQVLSYKPRDGHLDVRLRPVPRGTVVQVQTGRHPPFWNKVFFYEAAGGRWYEWPRALGRRDPTSGVPKDVGAFDIGTNYAASLRPLDQHAKSSGAAPN